MRRSGGSCDWLSRGNERRRIVVCVRGRQKRHAGGASLGKVGKSKVEQFDAIAAQTVWLQPDIVRLQIAMQDALLMSFMNGSTNLFENIRDPVKRQQLLCV